MYNKWPRWNIQRPRKENVYRSLKVLHLPETHIKMFVNVTSLIRYTSSRKQWSPRKMVRGKIVFLANRRDDRKYLREPTGSVGKFQQNADSWCKWKYWIFFGRRKCGSRSHAKNSMDIVRRYIAEPMKLRWDAAIIRSTVQIVADSVMGVSLPPRNGYHYTSRESSREFTFLCESTIFAFTQFMFHSPSNELK